METMSETRYSTPGTAVLSAVSSLIPTRRAFPRYNISCPILIELDRRDSKPSHGVSINLCRSGLLARVDRQITLGTRCRISFPPEDRHGPELIQCPRCGDEFPVLEIPDEPVWGTVVRTDQALEGFVVAIMFEAPLATAGSD